MKVKLLSVAVLAAVSTAISAAEVQLYGMVDTYVQVYNCRNESYYAVGISSNTAKSSIRAIASAVNQFKKI